jgi:hypothetical protein
MTNLKPEWEAELERLGVEGVRILLSKAQWSADDTVQLWPRTLDNPSRRDIEDWLKAKHDEGERRERVGRKSLPSQRSQRPLSAW